MSKKWSWLWIMGTCAVSAQEGDVRGRFEGYAASIQVFEPSAFYYDREVASHCRAQCESARRFQDEIRANPPDPGEVEKLLLHRDPKVRTLAVAALFDREDPRHWPRIHDLRRDTSPAFPTLQMTAMAFIRGDWDLPTGPQTVGQVASGFARVFDWDSYRDHVKRGYSLAWFDLLLKCQPG